MAYPLLPRLLRPYAWFELPGWGRLMRRSGAFCDELWRQAPSRVVRGKWHGYLMELSLANWSERQTYLLGRFYDLPVQLLLRKVVWPGDCFVDVGANIGMITLLAARLVGSSGRVQAFEPNPDVFARLQATISRNQLGGHVRAYNAGLSDKSGQLVLNVITEHTGMGTFAPVPPIDQHLISKSHPCQLLRGDDVLAGDFSGAVTVKVDVEGFEHKVLLGMEQYLLRHRPAIVMEAIPEYLVRGGSSIEAICEYAASLGYNGYFIRTRRSLLRHRLLLTPMRDDSAHPSNNVLWVHPEGVHCSRPRASVAHDESHGLPQCSRS